MKIKMEAAYHEAGHIVAAKRSKFHDIVGGIDLGKYGSGETFISLSKSKLQNAGKSTDASRQFDKDVVQDLAMVLTAGFAAEQIAAQKHSELTPNRQCAEPDYNLLGVQLEGAGLSKKTDKAETAVNTLLIQDWEHVERIATVAFKNHGLLLSEIHDLIDDV